MHRRGEGDLLLCVSLKQCFVLLHRLLEKSTASALIQYAHSFIRINVQKGNELVTLTVLHNKIYSKRRNQVFLMHLMLFSDVSSQTVFALWFLGTHSVTWIESCLAGCQQKRLIISAGSWCQAGCCRAINSKLFHHLFSGNGGGNWPSGCFSLWLLDSLQ